MKVVFSTFYKEGMGGGDARVAYEIVPAFAKKHQVLFVQPASCTKLKKKTPNLNFLQVESVGEEEISIPRLNLANIKFIFKKLKKFSPDIVHLQDPGPISFLIQIWALENKIPIIYTPHVLPTKTIDFGAKDATKSLGKLLDSNVLKKYFLYFFQNCDGVVALNERAKADIRKFGYTGKISIIPNGRNLHLYTCCQLADISEFPKNLLFVGFTSKRKNQRYLLQVMRYLPKNYFLYLVGGSLDKGYLQNLERDIEKYRLQNVKLVGKIDHSLIPGYLEKSHIFVSASKMEVQSLVIMEALAAGRPVVGLSNETVDEFINGEIGFNLAKNTSPKVFAEKVQAVGGLPKDKYEEMCRKARQRVENFDWENIVSETERVYSQLIASKKERMVVSEEETKDTIEKLSRLFESDLKDIAKRRQKILRNDLYILLISLVTSLGGSFYNLFRFSKSLKVKPLGYLSKTAKRFLEIT